MRFIPTMLHGIADYVVGIFVLGMPYYLEWNSGLKWLFLTLGASLIAYSAVTDYELGVVRFLRVRFHFFLDAVFGVVMLLIPSLTLVPQNSKPVVYAIGILAILLALTTKVRASGTHIEGGIR